MEDFTFEEQDGHLTVTLTADLTAVIVPRLQEKLRSALQRKVADVKFDLRNTVMLDSSGIGLLIAAYNSLGRGQGCVSVINASADILNLIQNMRLTRRLNVTGREAEEVARG
jgi:anti-anti-sigma factor